MDNERIYRRGRLYYGGSVSHLTGLLPGANGLQFRQNHPVPHGQDVEQAHRCGKAAAFLTVEGAELLGCDPARLDQAAIDGVTAINLTWNYANALSGSSKEQPERGLSTVGRDFVRKMEDLRILVDVSHLSEAGFWDVAEIASRPFIASHSNAKSVWNHTRNLTNEQITAIIENQGVIGLNFYEGFVGGAGIWTWFGLTWTASWSWAGPGMWRWG